jgi:uncharacterized protein (TIGR00661 family)
VKILYGVTGEGMGHAIRSKVVVDHLISEKHDVELVASQRAADFLARHFPEVHRIHGLHIVSEENRVRKGKTLFSNVLAGTAALPDQIRAYFGMIEDFRPEAVITDFESWSYYFGQAHRLPVLSIDNQQLIARCRLPEEVLAGHEAEYRVVKAFIQGKLPFCDHYLITSFFYPPVRKERTSIHPPILRPEILRAEAAPGEHLLVYQTGKTHDALVEALDRSGLECRIYGMRREIKEEQVDGRLRFRPFSETTFIDDLRTARGVVASAGFTLMGECVYLHKPLLAVPLGGQFEQILNARMLERERYGMAADEVDTAVLGRFLEELPIYEEALGRYRQDGNRDLLGALDSHLDRAAAGVY